MSSNHTLLQRAALALGLPVSSIHRIAASAPHRYKIFYIQKRSGRGMRLIGQPAKEVKLIQRWLIGTELAFLPVHRAATAYVTGSSIRENARRHLGSRFLLKADFSNFFPSIKSRDVANHLLAHASGRYTEEEIELVVRILCWHRRETNSLELCVGAPSSPFLSNTMMFDFDTTISAYCELKQIMYTRYADDLAFSTNIPNQLTAVPNVLRTYLQSLASPRLALNEDKTVFTSKKFHRSITGVVLASQGHLSLGRDKKRQISAMVHRYTVRLLSNKEIAALKGLLAFAQDVEPDFVGRLGRKYTEGVISSIQGFQP